MNRSGGLELSSERDLAALFRDSLRVYFKHFGTFIALSAAIVVPVELIVSGIGLEQLSAGYDPSPAVGAVVISIAVTFLVVVPLVTAVCIQALRSVALGGSPGAREALLSGFEAFTPLFFAVLLAATGIAIGVALLFFPGVYLAVRWLFVPQAVMIEQARGTAALDHSGAVVKGYWPRTLLIVLAANVVAFVPGLLLTAPFAAAAESSDRAIWALIGNMATETVTTPFVALLSTLLYYDLKARKEALPL